MTSIFLSARNCSKIMFMVGIELIFTQKVAGAVDAMNNPTYTTRQITVSDCLVAPISEPATAREEQAMAQSKDQVRIHLPKTCTDDVSGSDVIYDGKTFHLDSDSVKFMDGNTPTRWNRYFRAESLNG